MIMVEVKSHSKFGYKDKFKVSIWVMHSAKEIVNFEIMCVKFVLSSPILCISGEPFSHGAYSCTIYTSLGPLFSLCWYACVGCLLLPNFFYKKDILKLQIINKNH